MFDRLKDMYIEGRIDKAGLEKAVRLKWITKEQMIAIIG